MPRSPLRPGSLAVVLFTLAYLLPATAIAVWQINTEFTFYVVVMFILAAIVAGIHVQVNFSTGLLWALSAWGLLHMAGGLVPVPDTWPINGKIRVLYSLWLIPGWLKYDQVVHAYGFGTTAFACWQGLRWMFVSRVGELNIGHADRPIRPSVGMLVLCGAAAMGFGALNEVIEFAAAMTMPNTNVGGYVNTGYDLVANLAGVSVACTIIWLASRRR